MIAKESTADEENFTWTNYQTNPRYDRVWPDAVVVSTVTPFRSEFELQDFGPKDVRDLERYRCRVESSGILSPLTHHSRRVALAFLQGFL